MAMLSFGGMGITIAGLRGLAGAGRCRRGQLFPGLTEGFENVPQSLQYSYVPRSSTFVLKSLHERPAPSPAPFVTEHASRQ